MSNIYNSYSQCKVKTKCTILRIPDGNDSIFLHSHHG